MSRTFLRVASALALLTLLLTPLAALAHEKVDAGDYVIEYGWANEPPLAGQPNAIIVTINGKEADHSRAAEGKLTIAAPAEGSTIQGDSVEVTIAVEGIEEHDRESLHWHLKVDGHTLTMAPLSQTTITVTGLSNGSHTIAAAIALADHDEVGEHAQATITIEGSTATGEPSVTGLEPATESSHGGDDLEVDVSNLKVELVYGGETHILTLQPKTGGEHGQFTADFTPERPGQYTLRFSGKLSGSLGEAEVNAEVEPEEVTPDPNAPASAPAESGGPNTTAWIVIGGVGILLVGAVVGGFVIMRRK